MYKYPYTSFLLSATQLFSTQHTFPVSAGEANDTGCVSSFIVGKVFYNSNASSTGSVSQRVQQVFEFQTLSTSVPLTSQLNVITYPNTTKK